jgi:hypothetical protein
MHNYNNVITVWIFRLCFQNFCLVFGRFPVRISAVTRTILTEASCSLPQSLRANEIGYGHFFNPLKFTESDNSVM